MFESHHLQVICHHESTNSLIFGGCVRSHVLTIVYQSLGRQQSVTASYCRNAYEDRRNRKACGPPETLCLVLWSRSGAADSFLWLPGNLCKARKAGAPWKKKWWVTTELRPASPSSPIFWGRKALQLAVCFQTMPKTKKRIDSGQCNIYQECFWFPGLGANGMSSLYC